jgi:hypothetical protein
MDHRSSLGIGTTLGGFSQGLWGNQDRLVVAVAVAEAEPADLYAQALGEHIGLPDSRIGPHLKRFVELGLLLRLPKAGSERRIYHQRINDGFWEAVRHMGESLEQQ